MWIWGHNAGSHDGFGIPKASIATPLEGAMYLGTPNMCRVVFGGKPEPPYEQEALVLDCLNSVVWSLLGDASTARSNEGVDDVEAVALAARTHPNIIGGIVDDFLSPARQAVYAPSALADFKQRLTRLSGRDMQLWTVIYTHELTEAAMPYLNECDVATLWTWKPEDISQLDEHFACLRRLFPRRPILGGCYLWDYSAAKPMPTEQLTHQLAKCYEMIVSGKMEGVIFCSNNVIDLGLESVDIVRKWILTHKDEVV